MLKTGWQAKCLSVRPEAVEMERDSLHQTAIEVAKRILSGTKDERYELGVTEPEDNSRVFGDLVELAKQLLREEEVKQSWRVAA
jgi:hypothetical protein